MSEKKPSDQFAEERVARRTRDLTALYEVTAVASQSLDLWAILEHGLERVLKVLDCPVGAIQLVGEKGEGLRLAARQGLATEEETWPEALTELAKQVLEQGEPLVVRNLTAGSPLGPDVGLDGQGTYLGAPMRAAGSVLGVLSACAEAGRLFSVEDVALLATVADHLAVAVENYRLRQQAKQAAVMEERERLARELHDSITQSLYSLTLFAEEAQELVAAGDLDRLTAHLDEVEATASQALKEMRLLLYELRPAALRQTGLIGALQQRLKTVEKRAGVDARLLAETSLELPAPLEEGLYRIAQEALNNALKHARATSVTVQVYREGEEVVLEVLDNGRGFDPTTANLRGGMGLSNMRQRAKALGGTLTISSEMGKGTRVRVVVGGSMRADQGD